MAFTAQNGLALLQLIIYIPFIPIAILLCVRHGFSKSSGWRFGLLFLLLRVAGGIASMVTISTPTTDAYATVLVCASIGLSPLVLLCSGLLSRVNDGIPSDRRIAPNLFTLISVVSLVGLILGIVGGATGSSSSSSSSSSTDGANAYGTSTYSRVANILFLVVWVATLVLLALLSTRTSLVPRGERRLLLVSAIDLPLIFVRLVYSLVHAFGGGPKWSPVFGDIGLYAGMAIVEEIIVVVGTLGTGLTLKKGPPPAYGAVQVQGGGGGGRDSEMGGSSGGVKRSEHEQRRGQQQRRSRPRGPIGLLVFAVRDGVEYVRNKH